MESRNIDVLLEKEKRGTLCSEALEGQVMMEEIQYGQNTAIHFGLMNKTIGENFSEWKEFIHQLLTTSNLKTAADVVILGAGNADLYKIRQSPSEFAQGFMLFIHYMRQIYGKDQVFIVKTTRWMSGKYYGKSEAYANAIRSIVNSSDNPRILLWDTHQFGMKETELSDYAFKLENRMLERVFCQLPQRESYTT